MERQENPQDRRSHALALTAEGRRVLEAIGRVAREHQDALLGALSPAERETLLQLLLRVADDQGLTRGVHPGFARLASPVTGKSSVHRVHSKGRPKAAPAM